MHYFSIFGNVISKIFHHFRLETFSKPSNENIFEIKLNK